MRIQRTFTAREITILSGATKNYAHKILRELASAGDIRATGQKKNLAGNPERAYRVIDDDALFLKYLTPKGKRI